MINEVRIFWKVLIVIALALVVSWHTLVYPIGRDQGFFAYASKLILSGKTPYTGFWDVKPPLIFLLYAFNFAIFGKSIFAIRLFDLLWQSLTAFFIGLLAAKISNRKGFLYATPILYLYCYYTLIIPYWTEAQPDGYLILPVTLGLYLATSVKSVRWFLSGMFFGVAFWLKYHSIAFVLPLVAILLENREQLLRRTIFWALGFFIPAGTVLLYLFGTGSLQEFLKIELEIAPKYTGLDLTSGNLARFLSRLSQVQMPPFVGPMLWLCAITGITLATPRERKIGGFLIASGLLFVLLQAKLFSYHHLPLVFSLAIPAGAGLYGIATSYRTKSWAKALGLVFVVLSAITLELRAKDLGPDLSVIFQAKSLNQRYFELGGKREAQGDFSYEKSYKLAEFLKVKTEPNQSVFIWGFEPIVYFLSDRNPPTRFIMNTPFFGAMENKQYVGELISDLNKNMPEYFVVAKNDALVWVRGTEKDSFSALSQIDELKQFLADNYFLDLHLEDYEILRLNR